MSPRIGVVLLVPALWLAGSALGAQEACGLPEGAGPRIDAAAPVVVRSEGATVCACGVFPDRAALEGLRIDGRPVKASVDAFGRVATLRVPSDLAPGSYEITGTPEAGYGPEDRAEIRLIDLQAERCERFFSWGKYRRVCVSVEGSDEPVALRVRNQNPELVALLGGSVLEVQTSGGGRNRAVIEGRATGVPGHWTLDVDPATPACPCAAGGEEGIPPARVAELEACLAAAVAEIEAWFDGRAEALAARARRSKLAPAEVVTLLDQLEGRFLRVLATPDLAALGAWVEDELATERELWSRAPAGPVPAAARAATGVLRFADGQGLRPSIARAQAEGSQGFGAFWQRISSFFGDLREVSSDLVVDLCVRSRPSGASAWLQPKRYSEGRRSVQTTDTEFLNLGRGIYVGEVEGKDGRAPFEVDLVRRYSVYVECTLGSVPCGTQPRPAELRCREGEER